MIKATSTIELSAASSLRHERSRDSSFAAFPQHTRSITLSELKEFYNTRREWLGTLQWRCDSCQRRYPHQSGPCPTCSCTSGSMQTPNLYEVNEEMIKPLCAAQGVSYVELLYHQGGCKPRIPPRTFVSHWWGEEFQKLVCSLERYATMNCRVSGNRWWSKSTYVLTYVLSCFCGAYWLTLPSEPHELESLRKDSFVLPLAALPCMFAVVLMTLVAEFLHASRADPGTWAFWICAFCNNQFWVDHALAVNGDVYSSSFALALRAESCQEFVCVLDPEGEIYRRAWCVFELFVVHTVLPQTFGIDLKFAMVNEAGVISDGDASSETVTRVNQIIKHVHSATAEATVDDDLRMIRGAVQAAGVSDYELDDILVDTMAAALSKTRKRRRFPLVQSALVPIMACLSSYLLSVLLQHYLQNKKYTSVMLPFKYMRFFGGERTLLEFILLENFVFCAVLAWLASPRSAWQLQSMLCTAFPLLLLNMFVRLFQIYRAILHDDSSCNDRFCNFLRIWRRLGELTSFWSACLGTASGIFFHSVRDQHWFTAVRQIVEDAFTSYI